MIRNMIHGIAFCLAALLLPAVVACSSQEESLPDTEGRILAVFTLDLRDAAYGASAAVAAAEGEYSPSDGEYDPGSGLENFIDFFKKNYRCLLFGTDNIFISTLPAVSIQEMSDNLYKIRLRLDDTEEVKNALTNGCRFVFLANWGTYPEPVAGVTTIEQLCADANALFGFSQEKTLLSSDNLIPMYGVKEFVSGVQDYKDGKDISDIGTIHLLRAYAKVDVNINFVDFAEIPENISVSLTHSNDKGFKAPANVVKEDQYITNSWLTDYTPVNIPADAADIQLSLTKDETSGHYIAYVPEFKNVDGDKNPLDSRSQIKVSFTIGDVAAGGLEVEREFDFRYSDNPPTGATPRQHFDIARNNWYKFNITAQGKDIVWTVDVIPFSYVELKPEYGLVREPFTGYIVGEDYEKRPCWYEGNYYDPEKAVPLYLGPKDNQGEFVTINGKDYLLVYADFERTAANLIYFFEKETRKKYLLDPAGRTGYTYTFASGHPEWGPDIYYNKLQQRVWLSEDYNEWDVGTQWIDDPNSPTGKKEVPAWYWKTETIWYRTLNEWDRLNWNQAVYWHWTNVLPKYWFDVLGNRYPWSKGDTKEKRADIIGDWVKYLE